MILPACSNEELATDLFAKSLLFLYRPAEFLFDSIHGPVNLVSSPTVIVKSQHGQHPFRIFTGLKMTVSGYVHEFVPRTFNQCAKCGHPVL